MLKNSILIAVFFCFQLVAKLQAQNLKFVNVNIDNYQKINISSAPNLKFMADGKQINIFNSETNKKMMFYSYDRILYYEEQRTFMAINDLGNDAIYDFEVYNDKGGNLGRCGPFLEREKVKPYGVKMNNTIIYTAFAPQKTNVNIKPIYTNEDNIIVAEDLIELATSSSSRFLTTSAGREGKWGLFDTKNLNWYLKPTVYNSKDIVFITRYHFIVYESNGNYSPGLDDEIATTTDPKYISYKETKYIYHTTKNMHVIFQLADKNVLVNYKDLKTIKTVPKFYKMLAMPNKEFDAYIVASEDKKIGLLDTNFNVIAPMKYNDIGTASTTSMPSRGELNISKLPKLEKRQRPWDELKKFILLQNGSLFSLFSGFNNKLIAEDCNSINISRKAKYILTTKKDEATQKLSAGLIDSIGNVVIPANYENIAFSEDEFFEKKMRITYGFNKKQGMFSIDMKKEIMPCKYDYIEELWLDKLYSGRQTAAATDLVLINDDKSLTVVPTKFKGKINLISDYNFRGKNKYFGVTDNNNLIVFDEKQNVLIKKPNFDGKAVRIEKIDNEFVAVVETGGDVSNKLDGVIKSDGSWLVEMKYKSAWVESNHIYLTTTDFKKAICDKKGKLIFGPEVLLDITGVNDSVAFGLANSNDGKSFYNYIINLRNPKITLLDSYDQIKPPQEGSLQGEKYYMLLRSGYQGLHDGVKEILAPRYKLFKHEMDMPHYDFDDLIFVNSGSYSVAYDFIDKKMVVFTKGYEKKLATLEKDLEYFAWVKANSESYKKERAYVDKLREEVFAKKVAEREAKEKKQREENALANANQQKPEPREIPKPNCKVCSATGIEIYETTYTATGYVPTYDQYGAYKGTTLTNYDKKEKHRRQCTKCKGTGYVKD